MEREEGGGERLSTVSCSRILRKLSGPQCKLGSCKGRNVKIQCLFMRLKGGKQQ